MVGAQGGVLEAAPLQAAQLEGVGHRDVGEAQQLLHRRAVDQVEHTALELVGEPHQAGQPAVAAQRGRRARQALGVARYEHDARAGLTQCAPDREPDAAAAARDERRAICELAHRSLHVA